MDMRIDSIPGQPRYRITFAAQLRRMGTDMNADGLRVLLSEVGQTYALPGLWRRNNIHRRCWRLGRLPAAGH